MRTQTTEKYMAALELKINELEMKIDGQKDKYLGEVDNMFDLIKYDLKELFDTHRDLREVKRLRKLGFGSMFVKDNTWRHLNPEHKYEIAFLNDKLGVPFTFYTCLNQKLLTQ